MEAKQDMGTTNKNTNMQSLVEEHWSDEIEFSTRNNNGNIQSVLENRTLIQISQQHEYTKQISILLPSCNIYEVRNVKIKKVYIITFFSIENLFHKINFNNNESDAHNSNWMKCTVGNNKSLSTGGNMKLLKNKISKESCTWMKSKMIRSQAINLVSPHFWDIHTKLSKPRFKGCCCEGHNWWKSVASNYSWWLGINIVII